MLIKNCTLLVFSLLLLAACKTTQQPLSEKKNSKAESSINNKTAYNDFFVAEKARVMGDRARARTLYEQYISKYNDNATAYYNLAKLQFNAFDINDAEKNAAKAISLEPSNKYMLELYADIMSINKKPKEALKIYRELEDTNLAISETFIYKAFRIQKEMGDFEGAIMTLDRLEARIGISEEVSIEKAELYERIKQPTKAIDEIQKLANDQPSNPTYQTMLASIYDKNGNQEKANQIYNKLLDDAPNDPNVLMGLSSYYLKHNDSISYRKTLDKIIENKELDSQYKIALIMPYLSRSNDSGYLAQEALPLVQKLKKSNPDNLEIQGMYADLLYFSKQYQAASSAYKDYLKIDKAQFAPWFNLLLCYSYLDQMDSMISTAKAAIVYFPNNPIAPYMMASGYYQKKEFDSSIKSLDEALLLEPERELKAQIYSLLGDAYNSKKNYALADQNFENSLNIIEDATALNNYAYYLSLRGERLDTALKMSARSLELEPESLTFKDTYGWIFYKQGNYEKAKEFIEKAIDPKTGGDPDVLEHLGDIYYRLNNAKKAIEYWQKAKDAKGGSDLLDKKLRDGRLYE